MTKTESIRALSVEELKDQAVQLRKDIFVLKNNSAMKQGEVKPSDVRKKKKELAQTLTILHERELRIR